MASQVDVEDLVSATEIGERLNRDRNILHTWLRRQTEFPRPVARLELGRIWQWSAPRRGPAPPVVSVLSSPGHGRKVGVEDLVSTREIVDRLSTPSVNTVHTWRHRYADFPQPIVELGIGLVWYWPEIEE